MTMLVSKGGVGATMQLRNRKGLIKPVVDGVFVEVALEVAGGVSVQLCNLKLHSCNWKLQCNYECNFEGKQTPTGLDALLKLIVA